MTELHQILNHQHLDSWYRSELYKQCIFAIDAMHIDGLDNKCTVL